MVTGFLQTHLLFKAMFTENREQKSCRVRDGLFDNDVVSGADIS
jgi:hypothetical protein